MKNIPDSGGNGPEGSACGRYLPGLCAVDEVGDPKKIATKEARMTTDPRELMMVENVAKVIAAAPWFKDGFSFQTGVSGPAFHF